MKMIKKIGMVFILISIFMFKIDVVSAKEVTCQYEMYPVGYYKDGNTTIAKSGATATAKLTYTSTGSKKKNYTLKHVMTFGSKKNEEFNDSSFNKKTWKSGTCPPYVMVKKSSINEISSTEFLNKQDTFMKSGSYQNEYPMFLTKQNGKSVTTYATFSTAHALGEWSKIIDSNDNSGTSAAYTYRSVISDNQGVYSSVKTNQNWSKFSNYALDSNVNGATEKQLENSQYEYDALKKDYCYYYCDNECKDPITKDTCKNSCETTKKTKCEEAYNLCKDATPAQAKNSCIQNRFVERGLNTSYIIVYDQKKKELEDEIGNLSKTVQNIRAAQLKIEISPYILTCDDVKILHDIWVIIIIIAPVLVIFMGVLDFGKAVVSSKEENIKKAWSKFPKRVLAVIFLILVPLLISLILSLTNDNAAGDTSLMKCIIRGGE